MELFPKKFKADYAWRTLQAILNMLMLALRFAIETT